MRESHNNLISIMKQEKKYFYMIEIINNRESGINSTDSSIESNITVDSQIKSFFISSSHISYILSFGSFASKTVVVSFFSQCS